MVVTTSTGARGSCGRQDDRSRIRWLTIVQSSDTVVVEASLCVDNTVNVY